MVNLLYEKDISPSAITVSPRPVWKCRCCREYGIRPSCPPRVPGWMEAREWVHSYKRSILLKFGITSSDYEGEKKEILLHLLGREDDLFRNGYTLSHALFPGCCNLCVTCAITEGKGCSQPHRVRPSVNAIGIEIAGIVRLDFNESVLYSLIMVD